MNQRVKHIVGMLSMFLSIFISLHVFFACYSISNTLWCIFFKNMDLYIFESSFLILPLLILYIQWNQSL